MVMKRHFKNILLVYCGIVTLFAVVACTYNSSGENGAPTRAMALATNSDLREIGEGHAIYMRQCSQCHEAKLPATIPSKAWHVIVPGMAWNAGLSKAEEDKVHSYIMAASKYNEQQQ